jgi:hypothetical protein
MTSRAQVLMYTEALINSRHYDSSLGGSRLSNWSGCYHQTVHMTAMTSNAKALTGGGQENASTSTKVLTRDAASRPELPSGPRPPYTAFSVGRRRFILGIITAAGFFGPLAGGIYLPALPILQKAFNTSATAINATVSVFMGVLAVAVCPLRPI